MTHQRLVDYQLEIEPQARVTTLRRLLGHPHRRRSGCATATGSCSSLPRSTVETSERSAPARRSTALGVDAFADACVPGRQLGLSPGHPPHPAAPRHRRSVPARLLRAAPVPSTSSSGSTQRSMRRWHTDQARRPSASTSPTCWPGGEGVCQDFVHLGLAMFRGLGVPARYVSGYFYAVDGTDGDDARRAGDRGPDTRLAGGRHPRLGLVGAGPDEPRPGRRAPREDRPRPRLRRRAAASRASTTAPASSDCTWRWA